MRQPLIIGNWKMNGSLTENEKLLNTISTSLITIEGIEIVVCPPSLYMAQVKQQLSKTKIKHGAQNVSEFQSGAYTGEISTSMLGELGCCFVLLGHSERRALYHENDAQIADKFSAAVKANIRPVLCVGETLSQRQCGETFSVIAKQIKTVIEQVGIEAFAQAVVAYEPVWAIGTGETATPEQAQAVHANIRHQLAEYDVNIANRIHIIYGGSVNASNAQALFMQQDIDGGLVGGASLNSDEFVKICQATNEIF
ncbi:triose-phosphate isomerase [Thalassotalea sp. ND16A]|uniref:triose-phosphate isomerase n=1 Tax=Thalassotalea sp. ND16A TaxID=1535422 RepID=UPI00051A40DD|nr:triose-phosphate isomerase [Thalassotalea sp. ND16A]KGK01050.1 Triose-phosphate isomerase [Thalassotalea sp. ND16A]